MSKTNQKYIEMKHFFIMTIVVNLLLTIEAKSQCTTADAGLDMQICGDQVGLSGNFPIDGEGQWIVISGNAILQDATNRFTSITGSGMNVLRWQILGAGCGEDNYDDINVMFHEVAAPSVALTVDKDTICLGDSVTFSAAFIHGGSSPQFIWQLGLDTVTTLNPELTIQPLGNESVKVELLSNDVCLISISAESSEVSVRTFLSPIVYVSKTSSVLCKDDVVTLNAFTSSTLKSELQWYKDDILLPAQTQSTLNVSSPGRYYATVDDGVCPILQSVSSNIIQHNMNTDPYLSYSINETNISECDELEVTIDSSNFTGAFNWYVNGELKFENKTVIKGYFKEGDSLVLSVIPDQECINSKLYSEHIPFTVIPNNCGTIEGYVFADEDGDCVFDETEKPLVGKVVKIIPNDKYAITDSNGFYTTDLSIGLYDVYSVQPEYITYSCEKDSIQNVSLSKSEDTITGINFAIYTPVITDFKVSVGGGNARPGFDHIECIYINNSSKTENNAVLKFLPDANFIVNESETFFDSKSGDTLIWNIDVSSGSDLLLKVYGSITLDVNLIGKRIESQVWLNTENVDETPYDNYDKTFILITGSYDPNDKQVNLPLEILGDEEFDYTIRCQNTGNDTAFTVVIRDTIEETLDISTLRLGAASHKYSFTILSDNVFEWTFNNILLPDSTTDEPNSHGFVKFSIKAKPNLAEGVEITNSADIYFDFNPAIITNKVKNIIASLNTSVVKEGGDHSLILMPNPTTHYIKIVDESLGNANFEIFSISGQLVKKGTFDKGIKMLQVSNLTQGIYMLKVYTKDGGFYREKFIKL